MTIERDKLQDFERWGMRIAVVMLAGVVAFFGKSSMADNRATADAVKNMASDVAVIQVELKNLNQSTQDIRQLTNTVIQIQTRQMDHDRRINELEHRR